MRAPPAHRTRPVPTPRAAPLRRRRAVPPPAAARDESLFSALERQFDALEADVRALDRDAASLLSRPGTRSWERSAERVDVGPGGTRAVTRSYARVVVSGPPSVARPTAAPSLATGASLGAALVVGAWAAVAARAWRGWGATRFKQRAAPKAGLVAAWPLLAAASTDYRAELAKALEHGGRKRDDARGAAPVDGDDADA